MRLRLVYQPDVEYVAHTILADAARSTCLLALPRAFLPTVAALDRYMLDTLAEQPGNDMHLRA